MKYYTEGEGLNGNVHERVPNIENAEVLVVYGGDGTMLRAIKELTSKNIYNITVLGVNTGHVGFLSNDITKIEASTLMELSVHEFCSYVSSRHLLSIEHPGFITKALNEIVLQPTVRGKLFELDVEINNERLTYKGDGVIISTASGSTAYNLSAGGPIMMPGMCTVNITPICPFSLAARPIVVDCSNDIKMSSKELADITVDGINLGAVKLDKLEVNVPTETIKLFKVNTFFDAIHNKLGWNHNIK